jgi:hypothetical protein
VRETLEIATFFIDSRKPKIPVAANRAVVPMVSDAAVAVLQEV